MSPLNTLAQSRNASLSGTVKSDKDELVVSASVVAIHMPTGIRRTSTTDAFGNFSIPDMLPGGPFTLQILQSGFRTQVLTNVFLTAEKPTQLEFTLVPEVVAVGTRRSDRTLLESAVPVDVIDMRELALTAPQTDLTQALHYAVPSFNSTRQTSADGADHIDPISLRGLAPDQALVLINGKRYHTTGLINLLGSRGVGSVNYDLNAFGSNALDRVEILRDGAAAQYGSDAIAGVINLNLKSDNHGGNALLSTGVTSQGDGFTSLLSLNRGVQLGKKGFLNVTAEADYRGATTRGTAQRDIRSWPVFSYDAQEEADQLAASGKSYNDFRQVNGDAKIHNLRGSYNLSVPLSATSDKNRFYSFGGYNWRRGQAVAPWVLPASADVDIVESIYPYGYQPHINTHVQDGSAVAGFTFGLGQWSLDVSHVLGANRMRYDLSNSLNSSLGAASPRSFEAGGFQFVQNVSNVTMNRLFPKVLAGTNVAFGGEFRADHYEIVAGEEASWKDYGRGKVGASAGSQGFIGFDPTSAVTGNRTNVGAFLDVEADVTKRWTVGTALRYENYSDFGSAFIYKGSTRLQLAKKIALRAAYNTGFRAPALQQVLYRQLTLLPTSNGNVYSGIFNNQSDVARAAGIGRLRPEKSRNVSAGLVLMPSPKFTFTADAYQIDIDDRIILSGIFGNDTTGTRAAFNEALVRANADNAQFFTNAVDTRTRGLDLVATYRNSLGRGTLHVSLAANFNQTSIRALKVPAAFQPLQTDNIPGNDYIDQRQLSLIETGNPHTKIILNTGYEIGKFNVLLRNLYFGSVHTYDFNFDPLDEGSVYMSFRPKTSTDLMLTFKPTKAVMLTAGVNNLLNVYPDDVYTATYKNGRPPVGFKSFDQFNTYFENKYGRPSNLPYDFDILPYQSQQMSFNGRFFYLKAAYNIGL
ncbi:TonB-dependent receptor [Hymenobacter jeollabukensis]|uniref:TonB-dependent receptor n=1 Tax=Hymenobacter jeollabukensis TaxID=2025313 RepID=UPI0014852BAB|nr:TonB-dependent receptor [Hymenobacter jeollabukensis]